MSVSFSGHKRIAVLTMREKLELLENMVPTQPSFPGSVFLIAVSWVLKCREGTLPPSCSSAPVGSWWLSEIGRRNFQRKMHRLIGGCKDGSRYDNAEVILGVKKV